SGQSAGAFVSTVPVIQECSSMNLNPLSELTYTTREHVPALCVSRVPIFNHLPTQALSVIAGKATMRTYERGQFIHRSGDPSDKLFIVHKGKIKVYRLADTGKEQLMRILDPGDFAGELALFSSTEHDSYAEAMQSSEVCTIKRADVRELLPQFPDISLHV